MGRHSAVGVRFRTGSASLVFAFVEIAHAQIGVPIAPPSLMNSNAVGDLGQDIAVRMACDSGGHLVAIWQSKTNLTGNIGTDFDIFFSLNANHGFPGSWTAPAVLNSTATQDGTSDDTTPFISTDESVTWIAVWESKYNLGGNVGNDRDIFFARSFDNGMTWSAPAVLNSNAPTDGNAADYDPQVAGDGRGHWIAVWRSLDTLTGTTGSDADILYSISVDNGATWSTAAPLNTNAISDSGQDIHPRIDTDRQGLWICVWESTDTLGGAIGGDADILISRATWTGSPTPPTVAWSAPAPLNTNAATDSGADTDPSIATDRLGNWIVVWSSSDSLGNTIGTDRDILHSRSSSNGTAGSWSAPAAINTNAGTDSGQDTAPCISTDRAGEWFVVWSSTENLGGIGTDADILISRCSSPGIWTAPAPLNLNASADIGVDDLPCISSDAQGAWVAVWQSNQNLAANGTEGDLLSTRFATPDCNENFIPDRAESDCNANGVPDDCDIAHGISIDANFNGVPDECEQPPNPCGPDIAPPNGDGVVNVSDLLALLNGWGNCPLPPSPCAGDISPPSGNGVVNVSDLLTLLNSWGICP